MLDAGAQPVGRSDAVPLRRGRRPRAEVRRRDRHAARFGVARHRGERARRTFLRRRRGLLAEALRDLGPTRRAAARRRSPIRSSTPRRIGHFMPSVFPPKRRAVDSRAGAHARVCRRTRSIGRSTTFNRAVMPGSFDHARARRLPDGGPDAEQDALGAAARHAAVLGLPAEARHHVHVSRTQGRRARARR